MFVKDYKIGADIEVFLRNKENGEIVSAEGLIPGSKYEPYNYDEDDKNRIISLDNVMVEFGIRPIKSAHDFYKEVESALKYINSYIPKELETAALPAAELSEKYLQTENAKLFGCEPDFNVWTLVENPRPGTSGNLRTAGGHIHIGYEGPNPYVNQQLIKAMDIFVGLPSLFLEPDNQRKTMYGKAGAYRDKKYGVEYRTPSNFYLESEELTNWIFNNTIKAIEFVNTGKCNLLGGEDKEEIVNAINYNNKDLAKQVMEKYQVKLAA